MKKRWPLIAGILAVMVVLAGGFGIGAAFRAKEYKERLRQVYDGAVLSALRQMEDMELTMQKALLSADWEAGAGYLSRVSSGAAQVGRSLSLLPLSHASTSRAVKFANQIEDYTLTLIEEGTLTEEHARQLLTMMEACSQYTKALYGEREGIALLAAAGENFYPSGDEKGEKPEAGAAFDAGVSYPALIYDGPFSDARKEGPARGLGPKTVTKEEAMELAKAFAGRDRVQKVLPGADMGGSIPCWGVRLMLPDLTLSAAITKQGGKLLWMAPDRADFTPQITLAQCREKAGKFLSSRGFPPMELTFFQVYEGVAVLSFAPVQGETLLYPDLVKVQLRMDTGDIVGWEARNYWQNHTARGLLKADLSPEEALGGVSERLHAEKIRLVLIPTPAGEKLCYEIRGQYRGRTYLVYISAQTGKQEQILKVVEGETGLEAI